MQKSVKFDNDESESKTPPESMITDDNIVHTNSLLRIPFNKIN
jgi:hypothetical protein